MARRTDGHYLSPFGADDAQPEPRHALPGHDVDIVFGADKPSFGDLYLLCGNEHDEFPPSGDFPYDTLAHLRLEQVDDYFGIRNKSDKGDDVVLWLFPLVDDEPVYLHPGPFDGIRLEYSVLRNPSGQAEWFLGCITELAKLGVGVYYRSREDLDLGMPPNLGPLHADIEAIIQHWAAQGIEVGSRKAFKIDY